MTDININTNAKTVLSDLSKLAATYNFLNSVIIDCNNQIILSNTAACVSLNNIILTYGILNAEIAKTSASVTASTISLNIMMNEALILNETLLLLAQTLINTKIIWDELTSSINLNSMGLALNNLTTLLLSGSMVLFSAIIATTNTVFSGLNATISENTKLLQENIVYSLLSGVTLLFNSLCALLNNAMLKNLNETLTSQNQIYKELTTQVGVHTLLLLLNSLALVAHKLAIDKQNKSLTSNTSRTTSNNKRQAAAIGLKAFLVGLSIGGPAGLVLGPVAGIAATAIALGIIQSGMAALATGGVASGTTIAMIGEGKYPEAVIPLGSSPQFSAMKNDIANAVLQGILAMQKYDSGSSGGEVTLNLDGEKFARLIIPKINKENSRKGYTIQLREV